MNFLLKLESTIKDNNSLLCIGLDSDIDKIPDHLKSDPKPLLTFNKAIIDATYDLVSSYKFQIAYYSAHGIPGIQQLMQSISYLRQTYPEIPIILDAKRADIGNTSEQYAKEAFDVFQADAVTVNPYLGHDGLEPFFRRTDKGVIILCRTSNPGAKDFQDLPVILNGVKDLPAGRQGLKDSSASPGTVQHLASPQNDKTVPLYMKIAEKIVEWNKLYGNCLMVVGATYPDEMKKIRELTSNIFFLVPGIGAQGGDVEQTLEAGLRKDGSGLLIHSSRAIIYASDGKDFAERARVEAMKLRDEINQYR
jgi:orotidine-5'-phosphate decarboxylase